MTTTTTSTSTMSDRGDDQVESFNSIHNNSLSTAVVVCTVPLVQRLMDQRIPTTFIGVRNLRDEQHRGPSKIPVHGRSSLSSSGANSTTAIVAPTIPITYKVINPDGTERRMTRVEKKAARNKMVHEKRLAIEALKQQQQQQEPDERETKKQKRTSIPTDTPVENKTNNETAAEEEEEEEELLSTQPPQRDGKYHQLSIKQEILGEELAEYQDHHRRGGQGKPPVLLSPPMARFASAIIIPSDMKPLSTSSTSSTPTIPQGVRSNTEEQKGRRLVTIYYDHQLSEQWAKSLKDSMIPAEQVREVEDMRPMAYQLMPEAWTRLRPESTIRHPTRIITTTIHPHSFQNQAVPTTTSSSRSTLHNNATSSWVPLTCRPPSALDVTTAVVFEYLYKEMEYHMSCGAKFGADFLLYDGPRHERHAFGGLRIVQPGNTHKTNTILPFLSTYEMAAYVRCLNTAGKLALLATVIVEGGITEDDPLIFKVAFVDLALEKILTAPTHQRFGRSEKRRDVAKNLAKK